MPVAGVLALALALTGCGGDEPKPTKPKGQNASECRDQWHDVAESVLGLDQETEPSSLASRWNSIVATIQYYESSATAENCQETIEAQLKAITALRQLNSQLRPYDMSYQLRQVSPAVDLYLHDPLPKPARDDNGKLVRPPAHTAVQQSMNVLTQYAAPADVDLEAGWGQLASVDLGDIEALRSAIRDLDQLAQDSVSWQRCQVALQVIVAAIRAQEGLVGAPSDPTQTPTSVPSGTATP